MFPNCSIFFSLGSYLGILYCFSNVFGCSYFILPGPPTCPIGFTSFVSFKFILCISILMSSISLLHIWLILLQSHLLLFVYLLLFFFDFLILSIVLITFHLGFLFLCLLFLLFFQDISKYYLFNYFSSCSSNIF